MAGQIHDLGFQLEALFSMAVAHMESQGVNVEPAEGTTVAGPDKKRRKLFHVYQQTKKLLSDLRVDDEDHPALTESPAGLVAQPEPVSSGEPESSNRDEHRSEASSGLDDDRGDPTFEPSESNLQSLSDDTSQMSDPPAMRDSEEISVEEHNSVNSYDNDFYNDNGRGGIPEEIDNALLIPVLGQVIGSCQNCNERPAQTVCYDCGTGQFCDYDCWKSSQENDEKHTCSDVDQPWPACDYMQEIVTGSLPFNRDHFGFSKCRSVDEESTLIGLYRHLYMSYGLNLFQLHQWWEAKQLYNNIAKTFTRRPHLANYTYVSWLKRRGNAIFSEEERSEVLNLDLFD
ncbi:unnamed protein product [Clonostachys rosea]|uniref:Suppressor of anucleate metulae protein B n=1 Tax=Bionectria ochroleuca TaxID=29856 RepID=A0ABY6UJC8_BIOOC|nr:unnamed protein product [Clonostachys rosea]